MPDNFTHIPGSINDFDLPLEYFIIEMRLNQKRKDGQMRISDIVEELKSDSRTVNYTIEVELAETYAKFTPMRSALK